MGSSTSQAIAQMGKLLDYLITVLVVVMFVALIIGVYRIVLDIRPIIFASSFDSGAKNFVIDTLSIFVVLELLLGFMQYHGANKISPVYILDAGLFFTTRELMIELYTGNISYPTLLSFGAVIAVLGYTRAVLSRSSEQKAKAPSQVSQQD
ncbi:MAG: phosphate-starvation-inducible PsiE family protein [Thermoprotei archaeon]